jgi:hypothetical protein
MRRRPDVNPKLIVLPALVLAACTAGSAGPARQEAIAAVTGEALGPAVSCLSLRDIRSVDKINDYVAVIRMQGGKTYRSDMPASCPHLGRDPYVHRSFAGDMCRGEILRFFDSASRIEYGSCTFGEFVPFRFADGKAEG